MSSTPNSITSRIKIPCVTAVTGFVDIVTVHCFHDKSLYPENTTIEDKELDELGEQVSSKLQRFDYPLNWKKWHQLALSSFDWRADGDDTEQSKEQRRGIASRMQEIVQASDTSGVLGKYLPACLLWVDEDTEDESNNKVEWETIGGKKVSKAQLIAYLGSGIDETPDEYFERTQGTV